MNERIYKFYDKNKDTITSYDNVTEEEFDTLQYYYKKVRFYNVKFIIYSRLIRCNCYYLLFERLLSGSLLHI